MKLAFYRSCKGNWLDTLIDLASGRYGYSHVELVFDRISTDTTHGNLCFSSSPREGKCRFKNIVLKETYWNFVDIDIPLKEEQRIYSECFNYLNAKYDYYGILFWYVLFLVKKQRNQKWWCSEIVAHLLGWENPRQTPNELAKYYGVEESEFELILTKKWSV